MPDIPTIPQYPEQGIQATLDLVYLWNPDAAKALVAQLQVVLDTLEHILDNLAPVAESGSYNDLTNKPAIDGVTLTSTTTKADLGLGSAMNYKGAVQHYEDLPEDPAVGDVWNVLDTGENFAWDGTQWDNLGSIVDLTPYRTAAEQDVIDNTKITQYATMPTPTSADAGKIVQYIGQDTSTYQNANFYKCNSYVQPGGTISTGEMEVVGAGSDPFPTITILELDSLAELLAIDGYTLESIDATQMAGFFAQEDPELGNLLVFAFNNYEDVIYVSIESLSLADITDGFARLGVSIDYNGNPEFEYAGGILPTDGATVYFWSRVDVQPSTPQNVISVNGQTGAVVLDAADVGAIPQYEDLPDAPEGQIAQYVGASVPGGPQNGMFYKATSIEGPADVTVEFTVNEGGMTNLEVDSEVFAEAVHHVPARISFTLQYEEAEDAWCEVPNMTHIDLASHGITYEGTPADGDAIEGLYVPGTQSTEWEQIDVQPNPGGSSAPTLTWYTVSSAGTTLTIADTSSAQLVKVYKNGLLLQPTDDYTISGTTLTTVSPMVVGDKITTEAF